MHWGVSLVISGGGVKVGMVCQELTHGFVPHQSCMHQYIPSLSVQGLGIGILAKQKTHLEKKADGIRFILIGFVLS